MVIRYILHPDTSNTPNYTSVSGALAECISGDIIQVHNGNTQPVLSITFFKDGSDVVLSFNAIETSYFDQVLNNSAANFKKSSGNIYYDTGSVAIGPNTVFYTTSVAEFDNTYRLRVHGNVKVQAGNVSIGSANADGTNFSENITLNNNGNVRVGVNNTSKFTVDASNGNTNIVGTLNVNNLTGVDKTMVGLNNVDNTSDANKPVSTAQQTALNLKANINNPTFTGAVNAPTPITSDNSTLVATTSYVKACIQELPAGNNNNIPENLTTLIDSKAPINNPTFTGTVTGITKSMINLGNVDNTSDVNKPVSTAQQTALDLKAPINNPIFTGTVTGITKSMINLGNVDNTSDINKPVSTDQQAALDLKAPLESPTFTGTVSGVTKSMVGLNNVDNTSDANKPVSTAQQTALNLRAPLANPSFTGTVSGITANMVGLGNVDNTSDTNKPISTSQQIALNLKANINNPIFTGTVIAPTVDSSDNSSKVATTSYVKTIVGDLVSSAPGTLDTLKEISDALGNNPNFSTTMTSLIATKAPINNPNFTGTVTGITSTMVGLGNVNNTSDLDKPISTVTQTALNTKAPINNPTFSGTVSGISKSMVQLSNVDNTSDLNKPLSIATMDALNLKANINNPIFTGFVSGISKSMVGLSNVDNTSDTNKPISIAQQNALNLKASLESPTFTGTVSGITSTMVGLGNVDNTSDINKPISTATQNALNLRAPLESPTFTGTVSGINKNMIGLNNVDNTSDINKPISTAVQNSLNQKAPINNPTFTGAVNAPTVVSSDNSTTIATTAYVKNVVGELINSAPGTLDTLKEIADALGNDPNLSGTLTSSIALKAPIANPTFTGDVRAPTVVSSDNSTLVSTTAFVQTQVNILNNSISAETQARNIAIQNETSARQASETIINNTINTNKELLDLISSRLAELYTFFNQTYDSVYSYNHPVYYNVTNIAQNFGFELTQNGRPDLWPVPKYLTWVSFTTSSAGSPYAHKLYYAPTSDLNNKTVVATWDANGQTPNFSLFPLEPATNYTVSVVLINKLTNQELTNLQAVQSITFSTP